MYKKWLLLTVQNVSFMLGQLMMVQATSLLPSNKVTILTHLDPPGPTLTRPNPIFLKNVQNCLKWREIRFLKNDPPAQPT